MQRVLLFGGHGFLGQYLKGVLEARGLTVIVSHVRLEDQKALEGELDAVRPDRVLSATGRTHGPGSNTIDYLEGGRDKLTINLRDNLLGPVNLALACSQRGIHCAIISTGCIFHSEYDESETALNTFTEDDDPNFFGSSYSVVKGVTDQLLRQVPNVLSLRIRLPIFGRPHARNTLTKIFSYPRLCSLENSVTSLRLFDQCLVDLMRNRVAGALNFTNPGTVSHRFIIEQYRKFVNPAHVCEFVPREQLQLRAERSNNALDTSRLEALFPGVAIPSAQEAVCAAIREYAQ